MSQQIAPVISPESASVTASPGFMLRIEYPYLGCTLLADALEIRGRVALSAAQLRQSDIPAIRLLSALQGNGNETPFAGMTFSGAEISPGVDSGDAHLPVCESIDVGSTGLPVLHGDHDFREYELRCKINFSHILDSLAEQRSYRLALSSHVGEESAVSNFIVCTLIPRALRGGALGGISAVESQTIRSNFFAVDGWALKLDDEIAEVKIYFGDHLAGLAVTKVSSPDQHRALPYPKNSEYCRFAFVCERGSVPAPLLETGFAVRAVCRFLSGEELTIAGPRILWLEKPIETRPIGELESIRVVQDGIMQISGWVVNPSADPLKLYLEGRSFRILLEEGLQISWAGDPQVESSYAVTDRSCRAKFVINLRADALGRTPGELLIAAESNGVRVELGSREMTAELNNKFRREIGRLSAGESFKASLSSGLSKAGIRKKYPLASSRRYPLSPLERILVASPNLSAVEGAPKVLFQILRGLLARGFTAENIRLIAAQDGALREPLRALGINVEIIPELQVHRQTWAGYCAAVRRVEFSLSGFRPQFVLANVIDSFWSADIAARAGIPLLWCIHESANPLSHFPELEPRLRMVYLERLAAAHAVFVAESTRKVYSSILPPANSMVIRNGLDLAELERTKKTLTREEARKRLGLGSEFAVCVIGTTARRKGQDVFIRAAAEVLNRKPGQKFKFFIVGAREGQFLDELRLLASESLLNQHLIFVPETPDALQFFRAADVVAVASREESSPLVILESFAYGVPLVSTAVFGLAEQVAHGENALVFAVEDSGTLASHLLALQADSELREKLIRGGAQTLSEKFSLQKSVECYDAEIRRLAAVKT